MPVPPSRLKTGVYRILNKITGKFYIGSTADSFKTRKYNHWRELSGNFHYNSYLQRSWNKYGADAFEFQVVEKCQPRECQELEQHYLDTLQPWDAKIGYNSSKCATGWEPGRKHSDESKAKMSASQKVSGCPGQPKATVAAAEANRGKKKSQAFKDNLSRVKKGVPMSEEAKATMKANHWRNRPDAAEIIERSAAKHRDKKYTEEHKEKIGANHWKNRPDAEEIRAKVAASVSNSQKGRTYSEEAIANMSAGQQRRQARRRREIA